MFGGLAVKGGVGDAASRDEISSAAAAPPSSSGSGFSFLQIPTLAGNGADEQAIVTAEAGTTSGGASAFGFLSGASPTVNTHQTTQPGGGFSFMSKTESNGGLNDVASNVSTAGSSFSFMNSMLSGSENDNAAEPTAAADLSLIQGGEKGREPSSSNSGFSFLSGGRNSSDPTALERSPSLTPQIETPPQRGGASNVFAGLSTMATTETTSATQNDIMTAMPPPPPPADSDFFSMSSPALPAGSGVSWGSSVGGGGAKKVVKKKRGMRVGVGSSSSAGGATESIINNVNLGASIPTPSMSFQPPPPPPPPDTTTSAPQTPSTPNATYLAAQINTSEEPPQLSPPMRVKAEMAMQNAEEFIKEKQRSAIAMAAQRAMSEKTSETNGSGSSSGWKIGNINTPALSPTDSEYQAAKAAAEEAHKMSANKGKASLFSGVSGFFGRKSPSTPNDASSTSYSSHGGVVNNTIPVRRTNSNPLSQTKEGGEPHYGDTTNQNERDNDDARRIVEERELAMFREKQMQEQERLERMAEAKRQQKKEEERKRLEQERLRQLEEQAKRRPPREKMQAALDHFADVTRTSTDYVSQLRAQRSELVKQRMEAEKTERFAAQQISYAEAQQAQAAEDEDFEAADRLASDIERHTLERKKQVEIVKSIDRTISQIEKQRDAASKAVVSCFADIHVKLKELQADIDDRKKEDEILQQFAKTSQRLSSETERLSNDLKHIERDESVLADEQKELESQITEETKEFEEKRAEATEKLEIVDKEVEELRKKLADAEGRAACLNKEISSYMDSIKIVRAKYSRQLGRLEKKDQSVKESRAEWQTEQESIVKAKAAHESVVAAHSEEMMAREKLIEDIKAEVAVATEFEDFVSTAFDATDFIDDDNHAVDSEVLKYEAALDEANNNVLSAEAKIENLQDEISAVDARVPILEAEKKAAAAKRDFKAAGKASKEIKDALTRKEQCEAELSGEVMERLKLAKEELRKVTLLLEEKKSFAAQKEKEASLKGMETLREKIVHLQSIVKEFSADSCESDSINVACVGAFVIDSQISVLKAKGEALGSKYGCWASAALDDSPADRNNCKDDAPSDAVIDDDTLQAFFTLSGEIEELQAKIEQAAVDEDYDTATDLEEKVESLRSKMKSLGYSPEMMASALENKDRDVSSHETSSNILDESLLNKYDSLKTYVEQLEADIKTAVADENFDDAAELEEKVQVAKTEIESLGYSVDDLEHALKNRLKIDQGPSSEEPQSKDKPDSKVDGDCVTPIGADTTNTNDNDAKVTQDLSGSDDAQG